MYILVAQKESHYFENYSIHNKYRAEKNKRKLRKKR